VRPFVEFEQSSDECSSLLCFGERRLAPLELRAEILDLIVKKGGPTCKVDWGLILV
jgi:hypothetical protein